MPIEGSESLLEADIVIIAFGFSPTVPEWLAAQGVEGSPNGRIVAGGDERLPFQTTNPVSYTHLDVYKRQGKGMAGGRLVVRPPRGARFEARSTAILGNTCLYGATGGELFAAGRAGERFAVRNLSLIHI